LVPIASNLRGSLDNLSIQLRYFSKLKKRANSEAAIKGQKRIEFLLLGINSAREDAKEKARSLQVYLTGAILTSLTESNSKAQGISEEELVLKFINTYII